MRHWILGLGLTALAASTLQADSLQLRNGRIVEGRYLGGDTQTVRFQPSGGAIRRYYVTDVTAVQFGDSRMSADNRTLSRTDDRPRRGGPSIPSGARVTVRTIDPIDSNTSDAGQTFRAVIDDSVVANGQVVVPQGADALLRVARVNRGSGVVGNEEIVLELAEVVVNGQRVPVTSAPAEVAAKARGSQTAKVVGGTAVVGAIIGAIAGGGKGAAIGAASGAGAGAAIQAIRGQRVQVASESKLDFTLTQPVYL